MALEGTPTNRTSIDLPADVSQEILQKTQGASAVMSLARQITLPGRGTTINVITSDPVAAWVGETGSVSVSNPGLTTKVMQAYKLGVIVPFSNELKRDAAALYEALIERLPKALGDKFDNTVFGGTTAPGSNFDTFADVTGHDIATDAYAGLVAADTDIATHGGILSGVVLAPQGKGVLLAATDDNKRPLFVNTVAEGAVPMILGAKAQVSKGAYVEGTGANKPNVVGVAGDWSQALYGLVEGVKITYSQDATLTIGNTTINLFEKDMFAVKAEIEVGFRADTTVFNKLTTPHT